MEIIGKNEQKLIVGGDWVKYPDGTWVYIPDDDEPENDNDSINI